ncbi:MAG TPA: methyltransferase domain-containing protein [Burkholderiales bacterium]|nr:methyltransferase domain-containing protein [Burkholderiales bacterium]
MTWMDPLLRFNSSRARLLQENAAFAAAIPAGARVLDAGAGEAPYRGLLRHAGYESADFEKVDKTYAQSTYVCDLRDIPVEDGRFDYILFNQVMEHLPEPAQVLAELYRVLRPGGRMLYTGPLFYEEHEQPYDFFRYTQFGLAHLFAAAGFRTERMDWVEGYFGTVGYQLAGMARYLPYRPRELGGGSGGLLLAPLMIVAKAGCAFAAALFHRLEMRVKFQRQGYPKNYVVLAAKPEATDASRGACA